MPASKRVFASCALALCVAAHARADGAFPDSIQLFLATDQPREVVLATNFGLLISEDDGATWRYTCELTVGPYVGQYQLGAAPNDILYARMNAGLAYSTDHFCTESVSPGVMANALITDIFADPSDPLHILAVAAVPIDGGFGPLGVYESKTGGASFNPTPLYSAPSGMSITGVEIAASKPSVIYLAAVDTTANPIKPYLIVSTDAGATFTAIDESGAIGNFAIGIAEVDPVNAGTVYLRVKSTDANNDDQLAVVSNGTVSLPLTVSGAMRMVYMRTDGALIVGSLLGTVYISTDGAKTFQVWQGAPQFRSMAERSGRLYAAANNSTDKMAVGVSTDKGATWTTLLQFDQICGLAPCPKVESVCLTAWNNLISFFSIPVDGGMPWCSSSDGGLPPDSGPAQTDSGSVSAVDAGSSTPPKGCGCSAGGGWAAVGAVLMCAAFGTVRRRLREDS